MTPLSVNDEHFLVEARKAFLAPEVLVVIRYVYGAGRRDFWILKNLKDLQDRIVKLHFRDSVVVMKCFEKISEGVVDQAFISRAVGAYTKGSCWILIGREHYDHSYAESGGELREELQDRLGSRVCIVPEPNYLSEQHSIGAYVPDEDGVVRPGAY